MGISITRSSRPNRSSPGFRKSESVVIVSNRKSKIENRKSPMPVPHVVIVGRPNVGKSSLLNWQAGRLVSVVDPMAGVTRDRVTYLMQSGDRYFEMVDTGGIGIEDPDNLTADVEKQIQTAVEEADLILFVVDGQVGVTPLDKQVAERLRP